MSNSQGFNTSQTNYQPSLTNMTYEEACRKAYGN